MISTVYLEEAFLSLMLSYNIERGLPAKRQVALVVTI